MKILIFLTEGLNLKNAGVSLDEKNRKYIMNAAFRENYQRNSILKGLVNSQEDDLVIISDLDEIPDPISFKYFSILHLILDCL